MQHGLAAADRYYQEYGRRARELKRQGKKIMGYLCAYVPVEIIATAGFIPFRIKGDVHEPITKADAEMETIVCPLIRSSFDIALKGKYDFMDGLVIAHACDSISRTYDIWKYSLGLPYSHFVNVPHLIDKLSLDFFKAELGTFRESLERFTGKKISNKALVQVIGLYNQNRARVRELYELRKSDPPLISGGEVTKVLVTAMSAPVDEANELVSSAIQEIRQRGSLSAKKSARIMLIGAEVDDTAFIDLIENNNASVVIDDLCIGTRDFWPEVDITDDPIDGLAERYLRKMNCPRTFREKTSSHQEYLEQRFGHIRNLIQDFKVDGVVLYILKYCDPFGFEVPAMKSYIESLGAPVLYLEDEYSMLSIGRLKTRIQAFLEMIA